MNVKMMTGLLLVLLTLTGCGTTVMGSAAEPVLSAGTATEAPQLIGEDRAKMIALEQAGVAESDVTRLRTEYEVDDGVQQYDVEFHHGGWEYEYEINAKTGDVISADRDKET